MPAFKPTSKKVWFITGAASGFGRAFAEYALSHGHRVAAAATSPAGAARPGSWSARPRCPPDIGFHPPRRCQNPPWRKRSPVLAGWMCALINTPSYGATGTLEDVTDSELRSLMEANFYGVMAVTRATLPTFRARSAAGQSSIS